MNCPICKRELLEITNAWDEEWYHCANCDYVVEFYEDREITIDDVFKQYIDAYKEYGNCQKVLENLQGIISKIPNDDVRYTYEYQLKLQKDKCNGNCAKCGN